MIKILVIEDELEIGEKISQILQQEGYSVICTSNGAEGVEKAIKLKPDLIICDIMMPVMDGYEVLDEIRKSVQAEYIPFLFLSAKSEIVDIRRGMIQGADDYLTKPFSIKDLLSAVESCIKKRTFIENSKQLEISNFKKELETQLSKEKLLYSILNTTHDIIILYHLESEQIIFFNDRLKQLIPNLNTKDRNISLRNLVHPEDEKALEDLASKIKLLKDHEELVIEYRLRSLTGNYLYFTNRLSIFKRDSIGNPRLYLSILQDITEAKERMIITEKFYERISDDLSLANSTQKELISLDFPKIENFQFKVFYKPMEKIGGDFLVTKKLENGNLDIFAGDVSGHGISSSLVSAMAVVAFKMIDSDKYLPSKILAKLHDSLKGLVKNHFISAVYLKLNIDQKTLTISYAGHPPLILIRDGKLIQLKNKGLFLILFDAEYLDETIELKKGDKLLLFSDGFFEAFNEDNKILGFSEFIKWIEALAEKPLTTIIETLIEKTLQYSNSVVYDDMTMFGFQYE